MVEVSGREKEDGGWPPFGCHLMQQNRARVNAGGRKPLETGGRDQDHIRAQAAAFVEFTQSELAGLGPDPARGFSGNFNGANLLGAILRLRPGAVQQALLPRGIKLLECPSKADLHGMRAAGSRGRRPLQGARPRRLRLR